MKFRLRAFGLHLLGSATALLTVFGVLYLAWYRWPGWYLAGAVKVAPIVVAVDLALGPLITLLIASPRKPLRALARDIGVVVAVQLVALGYAAVTLWQGRPLYYTFSVDCLEMVQASELKPEEIALAHRQNPGFVPRWYSLPQWIWVPLPQDPQQALKIMTQATFGGTDVIQMPRYYRPWQQGLPQLAKMLRTVDKAQGFSPAERQRLRQQLARLGVPADQPVTLTMWGRERPLLAVFDRTSLRIRAILRAD
jgi:hypothetical protein